MSGASSSNGSAGRRPARALGWFSLALGVPQIVAPERVERLVGLPDGDRTRVLTRAVGVREVAAGTALLARPNALGLWSRVAGDLMDLGLLAAALRSVRGRERSRLTAAAAAVAGVGVIDAAMAVRRQRSSPRTTAGGGVRATAATTVNRPPEEVYRFWRDVENLPTFMAHLESVRTEGADRSHWVAAGPAGRRVEWDAEIVEDVPDRLIAWRSLEGSQVPNAGRVRFTSAYGGRGTEVRVEVEYQPPGGPLGAAVATLFGEEPAQQIRDDLRRFKQVVETGEVLRSDAIPDGTRTQRQFRQRAAQPQKA